MTTDYAWPLVAPQTQQAHLDEPWSWNADHDPVLDRQQQLIDEAKAFDREQRHADDAAGRRAADQHRRQLDELASFNAEVHRRNQLAFSPALEPHRGRSAVGVLGALLLLKFGLVILGFFGVMAVGIVASHTSSDPDQPGPAEPVLGCDDVGSVRSLSVSDDGTLFDWIRPIGSCPGLEGQGFEGD